MPIIYGLVSRGSQVLAEHISPGLTGNFTQVTRMVLKKLPETDAQLSYSYDSRYVFHIMVSDTLTYMCMVDAAISLTAFQFLHEIQSRFLELYGDRGKTAIAFSLNADFQKVIQLQMDRFNSTGNDKIQRVRDGVAQVKTVMLENIDRVLERGEKIELLVERTEELDAHALKFKRSATSLHRGMWVRNVKVTVMVAFAVLVLIYAASAYFCGFDFSRC